MKQEILIMPPDNLGGLSKEDVIQLLQQKLKGRVIKAYLYGSFIKDQFTRSSDIDLILITETKIPFVERGLEYFDLREWLPAIEPLIYTPDEFERLTADPSPGFWKSVVESMRQIV